MRFLIINRPNSPGSDEWMEQRPDKIAAMLREWLEGGVVEAPHVLIGGGHMYICEAKDEEELAVKVRYNPFFKNSDTEVIPIVDALAFLERYAEFTGQAAPD
ncbi:MAG: hypothetical protein GWN84_00745 [Gammaproteobacteria bacterium]|nr:hypothetical protein [Gammaproteobacteria bacterium]NIR81726.1 hypothetical protein [Gammaproteobacteria bacterium]NIR88529.1 hypothetical protein [Gammaproteobacteria bacterium]NIU02833.1 hypothetical protein [Gammaproteobacteria bacterium]NIV50355.1 hypothetical protein [Gammaproteobacteria bacterium]